MSRVTLLLLRATRPRASLPSLACPASTSAAQQRESTQLLLVCSLPQPTTRKQCKQGRAAFSLPEMEEAIPSHLSHKGWHQLRRS